MQRDEKIGMRPSSLNTLFRPVTALSGVGPRIGSLIEKLTGPNVVDLLWHLPSGIIDRRRTPKLMEAPIGEVSSFIVRVESHYPSHNKRQPYKVICSNDTGRLTLVFFRVRKDYISATLPPGSDKIISGKIEKFDGELQISHPDYIGDPEDADNILRVEPIYPMTSGLSVKVFGKSVGNVLNTLPILEEWLDLALFRTESWPSWNSAVKAIHNPQSENDLDTCSPARRRLAYDELLANQLTLALIRQAAQKQAGHPIVGDGRLRKKIMTGLSFSLTDSQNKALTEIESDMASKYRMLRLLQGDVGSGKTIVSIIAMLNAVESGFQAVLMAPTEILARQHYSTLLKLTKGIELRIALLTGREKGKVRQAVLGDLKSARTNIIVGTHALFQEDVIYADLGIVIIDEQHRFGVHQRLALTEKGKGCDMLVMTATPIPRTLMLTAYGDMDITQLREKPAGRKAITTRVVSVDRIARVVDRIQDNINKGNQIFWICPIIEELQSQDLAAAKYRFDYLKKIFREHVGLIHGRMTKNEKDSVMSDFNKGKIKVLVATTIIEVGIDISNATIMIIEQAERFGLSQLHQLRGRVGRSEQPSSCLLMYKKPINGIARKRLEVMRSTNDGFVIAEEDLKLRGSGELLGTRQSGLPVFRVANILDHADLLSTAHKDVDMLLKKDPGLKTKRGLALRNLLYLFEREIAIQNLKSG